MLNQSTDMNFGNLGNQEKGWKLSACCYVNIIFFCKKMSKMLIYTKKSIYVTNLHFCVKKCAQSYISAFCSLFCLWTLFCLWVENSACYSVKLPRTKKPKSFDRFITNRYLVAAHWTGAKMSIHFIPSTYLSTYVTDLVVKWVD